MMKRPKYGNKKTDGFDSKAEARRISELRLMELAGEITDLKTQVRYGLIPAQYIGGKCVERAVTYVADAEYKKGGRLVVEDIKSEMTRKLPAYILKRKLMLWVHGIQILETK